MCDIARRRNSLPADLQRRLFNFEELSKFVEEFRVQDLRKNVRYMVSEVSRYFNIGWIGVCDNLCEQDLAIDNVMEIWEEFYSFLRGLQHLFLVFEQMLILWERMLYFVLFTLSFSEFPDKLRPPCTTMLWTIWPSLVVLWGVCWMFYDDLGWDLGDYGLPMTDNATWLFEDTDYNDLSQCQDLFAPFSYLR